MSTPCADLMRRRIAFGHSAEASWVASCRTQERRESTDPESEAHYVQGDEPAKDYVRLVHLACHLETLEVLSTSQVAQYNDLRGYTNDPCANVPEGHNEEIWRRHNGCDS